MERDRSSQYIKHVYWLEAREEIRLRDEMTARGQKVRSARGVVCTPLDRINKISTVAPEVWSETCARQGSWYRASDKSGLFLVVSAFELKGYESRKAATITLTDFVPPAAANGSDKTSLVADPEFREKIPSEWNEVGEVEKKIYLRWAKRMGSEVTEYDFLHLSQTANHANFMKPRLFLKEGNDVIPYSIDRTAHLCSCCLELFQVLGTRHAKKLVAPCPGASIFARLKPDRFMLVEKPEK